ncbi:thiamine-phosphate kinase [Parasphingopyxis lamellibrachiae]|uniref:Thiamine-monophosphate kinase n=1 Tax=Parasphingopyxis lamellibrachiae TaxID=680125 RepID=A0A3D9FID2_9SPHN|nr:thiamine-phosphate kinase [Parasphingopyxis lamellibrachiae]RED17378.1 thiamine-phosphate kinase [Parasphingopyxis lamellibrachiae]
MTSESAFIDKLRAFATHPAARGLTDDAATLTHAGRTIVLTHDTIVENVHFLPGDPPEDIGWKLAVANLSDLAAKGAKPIASLMAYSLSGDGDWDARFAAGLGEALTRYGCPLIGGDTVRVPEGSARHFGMTAIGEAEFVPGRDGASPGDDLWVSGTLGDAGAGLAIAKGELEGPKELLQAYRRPVPQLELGQKLAPLVSAMMDVSDGLLIDAGRMAEASNVAIAIESIDVPLSSAFVGVRGDTREASIEAATAGDDYELLFAAPPRSRRQIETVAEGLDAHIQCVGLVEAGKGLSLQEGGRPLPLPETLGWEH